MHLHIERRANVVAPASVFAWLPPYYQKITSWQDSVAPKTRARVLDALRAQGYQAESVFDATHGCRYILFVYRDRPERMACWDFLTGAVT